MNFWNNFAAKHPAAAKWVREGGLFVIVSNLITVFKYLLLQFLPKAFASLPVVDFGWPGIDITLFGETFKWNILGYDAAHGGLPYFCAYMIAMVIGECINFPIQRNFVFRSKGNLAKQIGWYVLAFCVITCIVMMVVGVAYCFMRGYDGQMFTICMGVCVYKMIDGLADVYEGRLQQKDKLYLAGISQAFRSVVVFVVFSLFLLVTRDLGVSSIAMAVAAIATFLVLTFPLALLETPKSRRQSVQSIIALFKQCFPVFIALFMYALIDNMPKFVMETALSYDNQLYFNALYFPAQAILLTVGFVYKPLLVRMAQMWADAEKRNRFHLVILAIVAMVIALTLVVIFLMSWIGIPIMSFMYGVDFEQFRGLSFIMIAAGGVTAIIDFLYQVITVLRRQKSVMKLYVITFGFSLFVPILLIDFTGLPGAVIGYLIVMTILMVLLVWEYISICLDLSKHPVSQNPVSVSVDE